MIGQVVISRLRDADRAHRRHVLLIRPARRALTRLRLLQLDEGCLRIGQQRDERSAFDADRYAYLRSFFGREADLGGGELTQRLARRLREKRWASRRFIPMDS